MKTILMLLALAASALAGPVTFLWDEYDEVAEGITGFHLKVGKEAGVHSQVIAVPPDAQTITVTTLPPGRHYAVLTAVIITDTLSVESEPSNEISFVVKPKKPTNLKIN